MKSSDEADLFKISRALLQFMGETHDRTPRHIILFRICNSIILLYMLAFIIVNFFYINGSNQIETIQSLISIIHALLKYFSYMYFKPGIKELLQNKFERFWNYNHLDEHVITRRVNIYKLTELVQASVLAGASIVAYLYYFKPILTVNNVFPFQAWVSDVMFLDVTTLACHYYFFCIVIPIVIGYDTVYLCLCIQTVAQIKLLKNRMMYFQGGNEADASYYIKCHQFLLSKFARMRKLYSSMLLFHYFVTLITTCVSLFEVLMSKFARMRKLYSSMLLFHYFVTLITTCVSLFEVLMRKSSTSDIVAKAIIIWVIFIQFAYYTFPAEMVAFELSDLSNSIYLSKWYTNTASVQKQLLLMMARSQDQSYFTGGGLIDINVKTFGSVFRTSFSFYTILRNVLTK